MTEPLPVVLVPGLAASSRLYAQQIPHLWRFGSVLIADHTRDDSMAAIARRILSQAPSRFALAGLSMGGYIAFEILRQAPQRVARLALLDTSAQPDTPEASAARRSQMALAADGHYEEVIATLFARMVHREHREDTTLRESVWQMAQEVGSAGYLRQQAANITRVDSRPTLASIRCPTLVLVGDGDELTPPERGQEIARGVADARLVTVPRCGHLASLEQPQAVTRALTEWLDA